MDDVTLIQNFVYLKTGNRADNDPTLPGIVIATLIKEIYKLTKRIEDLEKK